MTDQTKQRMAEMLSAAFPETAEYAEATARRVVDIGDGLFFDQQSLLLILTYIAQREAASTAAAITEAQRHIRTSDEFVMAGRVAWKDCARRHVDKVLSEEQKFALSAMLADAEEKGHRLGYERGAAHERQVADAQLAQALEKGRQVGLKQAMLLAKTCGLGANGEWLGNEILALPSPDQAQEGGS